MWQLKRFFWDQASETFDLPEGWSPVFFNTLTHHVYAKKRLEVESDYPDMYDNEEYYYRDRDYEEWTDEQVEEERLENVLQDPDQGIRFHVGDPECTGHPVNGNEDDEREVQVAEETFPEIPVKHPNDDGIFRSCVQPDCQYSRVVMPYGNGRFGSMLDFCPKCYMPWGMEQEYSAWEESREFPSEREGIRIDQVEVIHWVCINCFLNTRFGFEGTECPYAEEGFHEWITEPEFNTSNNEVVVRPEPQEWMTGEFVDVDTSNWTATPSRKSAPMGSEAVPDFSLKGWKLPLNFERDSTIEDQLHRLHWDDECQWGGCEHCTLRRGGSGSGYVGPNAYNIPPVNPKVSHSQDYEEPFPNGVEPIIQKQWDRVRDKHSFNDPETRDWSRPDVSVKDDGYAKHVGGQVACRGCKAMTLEDCVCA